MKLIERERGRGREIGVREKGNSSEPVCATLRFTHQKTPAKTGLTTGLDPPILASKFPSFLPPFLGPTSTAASATATSSSGRPGLEGRTACGPGPARQPVTKVKNIFKVFFLFATYPGCFRYFRHFI